ncbi:MAG: CRISPR-associated helicase Cas3' [Methylococcaceae bacterium]|nr:CRISPR-associated helicase Cas3' [Methylococcaceae bacterium]
MTRYYAHSGNTHKQWHLLKHHLTAVAELTHQYLDGWQGQEEAKLAGLLHDLGKYGDRFQNRLQGQDQGLDHWSQGAYLAITKCKAIAAALAIQGHHIGLQSLQKDDLRKLDPKQLALNHPQQLTLSETDITLLESRLLADGLTVAQPQTRLFTSLPGESQARIDTMLDVRRLFSALVDADFVDTEAHFNGDEHGKRPRKAGLKLNENNLAERALTTLSHHIAQKAQTASPTTPLNNIRQTLLQDCLQQARQQPGTYTLTAPTGSGKTLSMLSFALQHALENNMQRIILVVPHLSIIEQTAQTYRDIFQDLGEDFILEHHSMAGLGAESITSDAEGGADQEQQIKRQRLLSENWDAPLILTTSVQFLESLFSNRPSSCRKLHRIADAVILFDEVQTLPTALAIPSLAAVSHIASHWHSSIVFATATQPAFNHLHPDVIKHCTQGWQPQEIVADPAAMMAQLRRVNYSWLDSTISWQDLAGQLREYPQVLCIVNLKRHAQDLWQALADTEDLFHLSTNLCPLHRQAVLAAVRQRLNAGLPCRLIATQCIEAGVDVDFPVVYRAFAPLDAIIQAAGRCNREGKLTVGQTYIFTPEAEGRLYPDGGYQQAAAVTHSLKTEYGEHFDLYNPDIIQAYYQRLYTVAAPEQQAKNLYQAIKDLSFPNVAQHFRLIKNDMINIVVPYDTVLFETLTTLADDKGLTADWIKQARGLSISLYRPQQDDVVWDGLLPVQPYKKGRLSKGEDWFIVAHPDDYDHTLGYKKPECLNLYLA